MDWSAINWQAWLAVLVVWAGFIALIGWLVYHFITAPMGYQDKTGFHYGQPDIRTGNGMGVTNGENDEI